MNINECKPFCTKGPPFFLLHFKSYIFKNALHSLAGDMYSNTCYISISKTA